MNIKANSLELIGITRNVKVTSAKRTDIVPRVGVKLHKYKLVWVKTQANSLELIAVMRNVKVNFN